MSKQPTLGERLAVIENILESAFREGGTVSEMRSDIRAIRKDFEDHKQDYQALKNRGIGVAFAISTIFAALGVLVSSLWDKVTGAWFG